VPLYPGASHFPHSPLSRYQQTTNELQRDNEEKQQENVTTNSLRFMPHTVGHVQMRLSLQLRNQSAQAEQRVKDTEFKLQVKGVHLLLRVALLHDNTWLERELLDLQEAYKEKMRKCNAWEKVVSFSALS
jgi:hypothetical protein